MTLRFLTVVGINDKGDRPFMDAFTRALATPRTPAMTGYWLGKLYEQCAKEVEAFEAQRVKLLQELGTPVEGGRYRLDGDALARFNAELLSMDRDMDVALPAGMKLKLPPDFTPADWMPLMVALDCFEIPN